MLFLSAKFKFRNINDEIVLTQKYILIDNDGKVIRNAAGVVDFCDINMLIKRQTNFDNIWDVDYCIASTGLINGVYASSLTIDNASFINKEVYFEERWNHGFTASYLTYGHLGKMLIDGSKPKGVRVTTKGLKVFWLDSGWVFTQNLSEYINIK